MQAIELKRIMAKYLRYKCSCPVIALECNSTLSTVYPDNGLADILAINKNRFLVEVEVKVSLADLKADRKKIKHEYYRKIRGMPYKNTVMKFGREVLQEPPAYPTHQLYFAVPDELLKKALGICEELYPYAGLLVHRPCHYSFSIDEDHVFIGKEAPLLPAKRLTLKQIVLLVKSQSSTIVRLLEKLNKVDNSND